MSKVQDILKEFDRIFSRVDKLELEEQSNWANYNSLKGRIDRLETELAQVETVDNSNQLISLAATVGKLTRDVSSMQVLIEAARLNPRRLPPYHYELDSDDPDNSWDSIIRKGQAVQREFYIEGEERWTKAGQPSPHGYGWFGTQSMPIVTIVCTEPEYVFHSTKRLPGRFRLWCPSRNSAVLRFLSDRGPTLHDNWTNENGIPYGFITNAPIGIYVEPSVLVDDKFTTRPFDQTIENCMIVGQNGTLPIYLADNQDRLTIRNCNILNHQGAQVGIKHGPPIRTDLINQDPMDNVYLADPRFIDLQMEGPHNMDRPQAAIFATGNNIRISGLNLYGWLQGPYLHGGKNRYVEVQVNKSNTHDGRTPLKLDEVCAATLNKWDLATDSLTLTGAYGQLFEPQESRAQRTFGTHVKDDAIYGG